MPAPASRDSQTGTLIISLVVMLLFGASLVAIWLYPVPLANQRVADTAMGSLASLCALVAARWLHRDPSADRKLDMIYASTPIATSAPDESDPSSTAPTIH